jgi:hypothetical protein
MRGIFARLKGVRIVVVGAAKAAPTMSVVAPTIGVVASATGVAAPTTIGAV